MKYLTNSGLSYFLNKIKAYIASQLNSKASAIHTHTKSDIIDLPNGYVVDSTLDGTSSNAIANSAVVDALDGKSDTGHTHITSDITDFPTLATVATSGSYNDLSNKPTTMTPKSHTHGNITNAGAIGSTANKPLITTTNGVITTGSFGTTANTFCQGNDSRLSDARTPTAHTHTASEITSGLATVAISGSYNDLSNKPTIPTVNNATLTIQKNGATVKTFTANASSNVTANITVPTKTSDLTNDSHTAITMGTDSTSTASPAHGGTFTCIDSVTKDTNGHVTAVNTKTVTLPSDNNTDTKVTQNVSTANENHPILLSATKDATTNQGAKTSIFASGVKVNPSTGTVTATAFSGNLTGNVTGNLTGNVTGNVSGSSGSCTGNSATATKATNNANGKKLTDSIIKGLSISGKTITYTQIDGTTGTLTTQDTNTTYSNFVKSGSGAKAGLVPAPSTTAGTTKYLREDGTWQVPPDHTYTVNNATLTIQKNGTTVKTFTANASSNVTCNITVPTKTSDLTNDSGFITSDNTKIPLAGSNAISGSLKPATTNAYDLGGSSYQWNNAYIKSLTISDSIINKNEQQFIFNKEYSDATDNWLGIHTYLDKNHTRLGFHAIGDFSGNRGFRWFVRGQSTNSVETDIFGFGRKWNETSYMYINATLETDLIPADNNSKSLGSSTNKWKSFNGLNPGALSLPSAGIGCVDIRSTVGQYLKDNNTNIYEFTAPFDGWVCVGIIKGSLRIDNNTTNISSGSENLGWWQCYTIPFMKNNSIEIKINKMDPADDYVNNIMWKAFIYPCQGNV